ncbi:hypothetical protein WISP_06009 [Willisornis vidua]|uniref:Uncharacterized protein n=1 Tax=Willisornis vidua TaxID=1566151 RepID=A0ABQ9DVY6_9PASS|nr:hypothetical protein WISP_06009 [Willisornis vidua]
MAEGGAWLLVLSAVFLCNALKILLPSCSSIAALMISLIWKYYSEPVTVLPSKWLAPLERLVAFPTGVAGKDRDIPKLGPNLD